MAAKPNVESIERVLKEYGLAIFFAIVLAMLFRFFAIEAYRIPNNTMRPTFEPGDTVFVTKWDFGYRNPLTGEILIQGRKPERGELVVYSLPSDLKRDSIKRVIALPGDQIEINQGRIKLNKKQLTDDSQKNTSCFPELHYRVCSEPPILEEIPLMTVPEGQVFVLGDLRTLTPEMKRTKNYGLVPMNLIKAKVRWLWLSIEPTGSSGRSGGWFSRIRFERMFKAVE